MSEVPEFPTFDPFPTEDETPSSFIDRMVEDAYIRFKDKDFIGDKKEGIRAYTTFDAAAEIIKEMSIDQRTLFLILSSQTIVTPDVIDYIEEPLEGFKNFSQVCESLNQAIIAGEMNFRHDGVFDEELARINLLRNNDNDQTSLF